MQRLVELSVENEGLRITLLPDAGVREQVEEIAAKDIDADSKLMEVLEWNLSNTEWAFVQAEDIGALTDAPIVSDEVDTDDHGTVTGVGRVFWWTQYEVKDAVETLLRDGQIILTKGDVNNMQE